MTQSLIIFTNKYAMISVKFKHIWNLNFSNIKFSYLQI